MSEQNAVDVGDDGASVANAESQEEPTMCLLCKKRPATHGVTLGLSRELVCLPCGRVVVE